MPTPNDAVIVISSHVARGSVGNRAMVFALERLGFTVWAVPTIILLHHPGHGPVERIVPDAAAFNDMLRTLAKDRAGNVAGIISGYFASPDQAQAVSRLVKTVKEARSDSLYLCDPIMGDAGRLYLDESIAVAIRDLLMPLADIAKPNAFECGWLAGASPTSATDLAALASKLASPRVLVTSAPPMMTGHIGNLLVADDVSMLFEHPAVSTRAKGTGDLLAALVLARRLEGHSWPKATEMAVASVYEIVAATAKAGADELMLAQHQQAIAAPRAQISVRRLGSKP